MTDEIYSLLITEILQNLGELPLEEVIQNTLIKQNLSEAQRPNYFEKIKNELQGFGPIQEFLEDKQITEICINDFDQIFIETNGCLAKTQNRFASEITYKKFLHHLLFEIQKTADTRNPLVDGHLLYGTRVHISLPPVSEKPHVTLRKHSFAHWTLDDLKKLNMFDDDFKKLLQNWVAEKKNVLFCGPTSSGKTTLLRACLTECGSNERIVSLEDTSELGSIGTHHLNLITRTDPEKILPQIDLSVLLKNSLRMRPDRLIVGEVRGEEAVILLDALATGHKGSFCTLHAQNADHALRRLESLVIRACPKWDLMAVRQLIKDSIDVVVVCQKRSGLRVVSQAAQISSVESFGYLLDSFNY